MRVAVSFLSVAERRELLRARSRLRRANEVYSFEIREAKRAVRKLRDRARKRKQRGERVEGNLPAS